MDEVVGGHVEKRVEVHAAVAVLAERPLLGLSCGGDLRIDVDVRLRGTITAAKGVIKLNDGEMSECRGFKECESWGYSPWLRLVEE